MVFNRKKNAIKGYDFAPKSKEELQGVVEFAFMGLGGVTYVLKY